MVFQNRLPFPANIVPSGAFTNSTGAAKPSQTLVYKWTVSDEVSMRSRLGGLRGPHHRLP